MLRAVGDFDAPRSEVDEIKLLQGKEDGLVVWIHAVCCCRGIVLWCNVLLHFALFSARTL